MQRRASSALKAPEPSEGLRGLPGPAGPAGRGIGDAPGLLRAPGHEETMREAGLAPQVVPLRGTWPTKRFKRLAALHGHHRGEDGADRAHGGHADT